MALAQSTTGDFIRVPVEGGGTVEFGPNATLNIGGAEVSAGELYMTEWGLYKKTGEPIAAWDDVRTVRIEQTDGAADVAIVAAAGVAIVALAALLKSAPSSGGSGSKAPSGGGGGSSVPTRSAPNPSAVIPDPATEVALRGIELFANAAAQSGPGVIVATDEEPQTIAAIPMFSRGARRRANIRALARVEGGACWPGAGGDCVVSGGRVGVRLVDMFELTGGVRVESTPLETRPLAVFGAMLHGETPGAHWFALAAGASVAFDAIRAHIVPTVGVRFRLVRGLWLGLVPLEPVYATETGNWSMASGGEITGEL